MKETALLRTLFANPHCKLVNTQLWLEQRPERRAKEKEKRKQKLEQMARNNEFMESRSVSRKRLKHEQGEFVTAATY